MKNALIFLIFACTLGITLFILYSFSRQTIRHLTSPLPTVAPIPTEIVANPTPTPYSIKLDNKIYSFYYHKIERNFLENKHEIIKVIPNFSEATSSAYLLKTNNCDFGINGGFYTKEKKPLGFFYEKDGKIENQPIVSQTFNGFLVYYSGGQTSARAALLDIFPKKYEDSYDVLYDKNIFDFAFQSGPFYDLKSDTIYSFVDKSFARRNLAAKDSKANMYFFTIFEKDISLNGPRLEDIPLIFKSSTFRKIADFKTVLNLDGGSASAFYEGNVQVVEFKPIGSFLCGKIK